MQCALALHPTVLQRAEDTGTLAAVATAGERDIGNRPEVSHRQGIPSHRSNRPRVEPWRRKHTGLPVHSTAS